MVKLRSVLIQILVCVCPLLHAQDKSLDFIGVKDGLSQGMIYSILQDSDGFIWIATKHGLNRYDGNKMKIFHPDADNPYSPDDLTITFLFEDSRDWMWVGTQSNGLEIYDKKTERFYALKDFKDADVSAGFIKYIEEDKEGNIWVASLTGLYKLDFSKFSTDKSIQTGLKDVKVNTIQRSESGVYTIYFHKDSVYWGEDLALKSMHTAGSEIKRNIPHDISPEEKNINKIFIDKYGVKWIFRPHSFTRIDGKSSEYTQLPLNEKLPAVGVFIDSDTSFYILGYELHHYKVNSTGIQSVEKKTSLGTYFGKYITIDRAGMMWMGTNGYGIFKYNPGKALFRHLLEGKSLQHIFQDQAGNLYVWTNTRIVVVDQESGELTETAPFPREVLNARNIYQDNLGNYWVQKPFHAEGVKLCKWDISSQTMIDYPYSQEPNILSFIFEDSHGGIWISTETQELLHLEKDAKTFDSYKIPAKLSSEGANVQITSIIEDNSGRFWLGTSQGVFNFILNGKEIQYGKVLLESRIEGKGLSNAHILDIHQDSQDDHIFWFATKGGGLNKYKENTGEFEWIKLEQGLPDLVVYGILNYGQDLWLSTNKGLAVYDKNSGNISVFTQEEGLQNNEFNTFSFFKGGDSLLYFGGINGLNIIDPKLIKSNSVKPKVVISDIRVNDMKLNHTAHSSISDKDFDLELDHFENMITFQFSSLDFTAHDKNLYQYKLEGVDKNWLSPTHTNEITYANLKPGYYTFRVRGTNNSGIWSENEAIFNFSIQTPWWANNWAYSIYFLLILGGIIGIFRFQNNRKELKRQLDFEIKEAERLQALEKLKSNFFSGITHEFKTPLTLIIEPLRQVIEDIDDPKIKAKLELAGSNSHKLLKLVNDLLDMSKLEDGKLKLVKSKVNLSSFIGEICENFMAIAEQRNIQIVFRSEKDVNFLTDHSKFELVMNNLLMNAVKYTPEGGEIEVLLKKVSGQSGKEIAISVKDNGIGIESEEREKIFDRFYQVDSMVNSSGGGTGIGLALTRELVELMGGRIFLDETYSKGACFQIVLPVVEEIEILEINEKIKINELLETPTLPEIRENEKKEINGDEKATVLIVEDNADLRMLIGDSLRPYFKLVIAANGEEGIQKAEKIIPDLIVTDLMMPGKNGYELCQSIKSTTITAHIPVILLTAKSAMEAKLEGLKIGADDYITKPFHSEELVLRVRNLIESRSKIHASYQEKLKTGQLGDIWTKVPGLTEGDKIFIEKFTNIIAENLSNDEMTVEDFAAKMHISRAQLHRKITALTGQNTSEFIRNYRLDRAVELLRIGKGNINEISMEVGIPNRNYFTRKFKERFGKPPSEI